MKLIYTEYIATENIIVKNPCKDIVMQNLQVIIVTNRIKVLKFGEADQQKK